MLNCKYERNPDLNIIEYEVDESGALLYAQETEETHVFNETAFFIYQLLVAPKSFDEILQALLSEYEISVEIDLVKKDVDICLNTLLDKKVIIKI